ncbi:DUF2243 domain-containing protein [Nannocystis pusilla]|uniref:DUF2243 domain-containing protein n=1 Tax=Nannocystis pusilla TaxID=889268 RepID=A0A9X3J2Q9_9BACT|nr:DUF2243 domain-containing protein [Nannocystis pusilla]MCY1014067.1 DUF2243 domain-containing protein [Nannocystis pusilla]
MALNKQHDGPLVAAGIALGVGLGGFVDGILFHHCCSGTKCSARLPPDTLVAMKVNMMWDGLFHVLTWLMTVVGIALLWRAGGREDVPWRGRTLVGGLSLGWGLFNFVEGLVDHQLLGIHHVHPGAHELAWDLGFLGSGLLCIALGIALVCPARR